MDNRTYLPPPGADSGFSPDKERVRGAVRVFSHCFLFAAIYLIIANALMYAVSIGFLLFFGPERGSQIISSLAYTWIMQVVSMYGVAFPLSYLIVRKLPKARAKKSRLSLEEFVVLFFISQGVMVFGAVISNLFTEIISYILGYTVKNATSDLIMETPVWVVIAVAVILGPIFEELIFRKIFIDRMSVYGDRLAIVASSVAFGLFHGNFSQAIYATALGLILGYAYTKTRNVIYTSLLHMILNFFGTVPTLLIMDSIERLGVFDTSSELTAEMLYTYSLDSLWVLGVTITEYLLAFIGIALLIYLLVKKKITSPRHCEVALPKYAYKRVLLINTGAIILLGMIVIEFVISLLPPL